MKCKAKGEHIWCIIIDTNQPIDIFVALTKILIRNLIVVFKNQIIYALKNIKMHIKITYI